MPRSYRHSIASDDSLPRLAVTRARATTAMASVLADAKAGKLHGLTIANESEDLAPARALAQRLRAEADHILVLGIGGSSLGAQTVAQLRDYYTPLSFLPMKNGPRLHFLDTPDGRVMDKLFAALPLDRTRFVVVSKSGGTAEPMMQALAVLSHLKAEGRRDPARYLFAITEPKDNALTRLADRHKLERLAHPTDIGGRYAVLSVVGMFPALLMGLDAAALRRGAAEVLSDPADVIEGAAFSVAAMESGRAVQVMMPYSEQLDRFAFWFRQLWAESLGKEGKGTLPVRALGPVDQHSQLQFYLAGPPIAAYTLMSLDQHGGGPKVSKGVAGDAALAYLEERHIGDLVMAETRATYATLEKHGSPCRLFELDRLDETVLGALFMHFMMETIVVARMIGVDAFDQPAVEEGKALARRYLDETR